MRCRALTNLSIANGPELLCNVTCLVYLFLSWISWISSEHPNQGDSHRSKSHLSAQSRPRGRLPEIQLPDGSSAGLPFAAERGNANPIPTRSSPSIRPPEQGEAIGCPSVSVPRVGTATRVAR